MFIGISLVVQWLRLCTSTAGDVGLIPGQGTKIPHAAKKKIRCSPPKNNNAYHLRVSVAQEFRHGQGGSLTGSVQGVIWGCRYLKAHLGAHFRWGALFQVH